MPCTCNLAVHAPICPAAPRISPAELAEARAARELVALQDPSWAGPFRETSDVPLGIGGGVSLRVPGR